MPRWYALGPCSGGEARREATLASRSQLRSGRSWALWGNYVRGQKVGAPFAADPCEPCATAELPRPLSARRSPPRSTPGETQGRYGEQSDVWSIGVIMYILLCGSPPFTGNDTVAVLDSVKRAKPPFDKKEWKRVSSEAKQLLKGLLTRNPATRMNAADALRSPWITMALQGLVLRCLGARHRQTPRAPQKHMSMRAAASCA